MKTGNVIQGYKLKTSDIKEVIAVLSKIQNKIENITKKEFKKFLTKEIEFLTDQVSLNNIPRDNNVTILEGAFEIVREKVERMQAVSSKTSYNLKCFVHVLPYEDCCYLKVICWNKALLKAFNELEEYSLSYVDCEDKMNAKNILWNKLHEKYKKSEPLGMNLTYHVNIEDFDKFTFRTVKERAEEIAEQNTLNRLLAELSGAAQIPPIRLMRNIDEAVSEFKSGEYMNEYMEEVIKLEQILIDLNQNSDIISTLPDKNM